MWKSWGMPVGAEGSGPRYRASGVSSRGLGAVRRAALTVVLFSIPPLAGVLADAIASEQSIGIGQVMLVVTMATFAFCLLHAVILLRIDDTGRGRLWEVLPYLVPVVALAVLAVPAGPGWEVSLATAVGGAAGLIGFDVVWATVTIRRSSRRLAASRS
jgi:hypothetical protein